MMVLYHCVSSYHIIEAMIHRYTKHAQDQAVLIIADFTAKKFADAIELNGFFDEVVLFPYREITHNPETILQDITKMYEQKMKYPISKFDNIYVAAGHYYFSLYLIANDINFYFFEDGCGILSKPKVSYDIVLGYAPIQGDIAQTYGLFDGQNDHIIKSLCNKNAQSFVIDNKKVADFDVTKEVKKCNPQYIDRILHFFRIEKIKDLPKDAVLVFTQQLANLGILTFEEQILIYQMAFDFFLSGKKLLFKTHPDDVMYYGFIFPDSELLDGKFPAELLPVIADSIPETSFTIFSSSVLGLKSAFKENIFCGYDFDKTFWRMDRYYFALELISSLSQSQKDCYAYGVDVQLIQNLLRYSMMSSPHSVHYNYGEEIAQDYPDGSIILIDDLNFKSDYFRNKKCDLEFEYTKVVVNGVELPQKEQNIDRMPPEAIQQPEHGNHCNIVDFLKNINKDDLVVFINSQSDYCFYAYEEKKLFEDMIPIVVKRSKSRTENVYLEEVCFTLYLYTKNKEIRNMARKFQATRDLKYSGVTENVLKLTPDQERIAILEGILEATEKRLKFYIDKEKAEQSK